MSFEWSKLLEWTKPKPRTWFGLAAASGTLLLLPEDLLGQLGVAELVKGHRAWLGGVLLLSLTLLMAHVAGEGWHLVIARLKSHGELRDPRGQFLELSPAEKRVLKEYIDQQTTTRHFSITDGVVGGLVAKDILFRSSSVGPRMLFATNLQPWAWSYLRKHPEVLLGAEAGDDDPLRRRS